MAAIAASVSVRPQVARVVATRARRAPAARAAVKTTAALPKNIAMGLTAATSALVASPAFALVDDRLNGDGAGIALGVNDPILGAHLLGVFTAIWALYYIANNSDDRIQAGGKDDDSGLSL